MTAELCKGCLYAFNDMQCAYETVREGKTPKSLQYMMEEYGFTFEANDMIKCTKFKPVTKEWSLYPMGGKNHGQ